MNKIFEEIRKDFITMYPDLARLKSKKDFARAAIALAIPNRTTIHDLVVLCRIAGCSALDDADIYDDPVLAERREDI